MISVSVEVDIEEAKRMLRLLPHEANRAAYRSINKVADEVKKESAKEISSQTGIRKARVLGKLWVRGARANALIATVGALPSSSNIGAYEGSSPRQTPQGVDVKAWRGRKVYDRAFVKGPPKLAARIRRKVYRRTGPKDTDITDKVWGPSIRKTFGWPIVRARQLAVIRRRWPYWFERYLRGELVKLGRGAELTGVANVLPTISGPQFIED